MSAQESERKLTAILSANVAGYSRLMGEDEESTVRTLTAYRESMSSTHKQDSPTGGLHPISSHSCRAYTTPFTERKGTRVPCCG